MESVEDPLKVFFPLQGTDGRIRQSIPRRLQDLCGCPWHPLLKLRDGIPAHRIGREGIVLKECPNVWPTDPFSGLPRLGPRRREGRLQLRGQRRGRQRPLHVQQRQYRPLRRHGSLEEILGQGNRCAALKIIQQTWIQCF